VTHLRVEKDFHSADLAREKRTTTRVPFRRLYQQGGGLICLLEGSYMSVGGHTNRGTYRPRQPTYNRSQACFASCTGCTRLTVATAGRGVSGADFAGRGFLGGQIYQVCC
jgi:hypothetical protein